MSKGHKGWRKTSWKRPGPSGGGDRTRDGEWWVNVVQIHRIVPALGSTGRWISEFKANAVYDRVPEQPELHRETMLQKTKEGGWST